MSRAEDLLAEYYDRNGIGRTNSGFLTPWERDLDAYMREKRGTQMHSHSASYCPQCKGGCRIVVTHTPTATASTGEGE